MALSVVTGEDLDLLCLLMVVSLQIVEE